MNVIDILTRILKGDCHDGETLVSETGERFFAKSKGEIIFCPGDGSCYKITSDQSDERSTPAAS